MVRPPVPSPLCTLLLWCIPAHGQALAPADARPPSIGAVVKEMPRDLWKFVSWDTAIVVGVGGGAAGIGHVWDDDLADEVDTSPALQSFTEPGNTYGGFSVQVAIGAGLYATGWLANKGRMAQAGADIMRAQVLAQVYVQALKFSVQRERPDGS